MKILFYGNINQVNIYLGVSAWKPMDMFRSTCHVDIHMGSISHVRSAYEVFMACHILCVHLVGWVKAPLLFITSFLKSTVTWKLLLGGSFENLLEWSRNKDLFSISWILLLFFNIDTMQCPTMLQSHASKPITEVRFLEACKIPNCVFDQVSVDATPILQITF